MCMHIFCPSCVIYPCNNHFLSVSGKAEAGGGAMQVTLCDYIMPWDFLSSTQKKGLSQRYQMGCECKVSWLSREQQRLTAATGMFDSWLGSFTNRTPFFLSLLLFLMLLLLFFLLHLPLIPLPPPLLFI